MRLIVQYAGAGFLSPEQIQSIRSVTGVQVISVSLRSLLVEADEQGKRTLESTEGWTVNEEIGYDLPDTRKYPKGQDET